VRTEKRECPAGARQILELAKREVNLELNICQRKRKEGVLRPWGPDEVEKVPIRIKNLNMVFANLQG